MASNITSQDLLNVGGNPDTKCMFLIDGNTSKGDGKRSTFRPPASSILERARDFLPQLANANKVLEERMKMQPPESLNIEHLEDSDEKYIEMNVALVEQDSQSDSDLDLNDSSDSCEESSENENDQPLLGEVTAETLKITPTKSNQKPHIEILQANQDNAKSSSDQISEPKDS